MQDTCPSWLIRRVLPVLGIDFQSLQLGCQKQLARVFGVQVTLHDPRSVAVFESSLFAGEHMIDLVHWQVKS